MEYPRLVPDDLLPLWLQKISVARLVQGVSIIQVSSKVQRQVLFSQVYNLRTIATSHSWQGCTRIEMLFSLDRWIDLVSVGGEATIMVLVR